MYSRRLTPSASLPALSQAFRDHSPRRRGFASARPRSLLSGGSGVSDYLSFMPDPSLPSLEDIPRESTLSFMDSMDLDPASFPAAACDNLQAPSSLNIATVSGASSLSPLAVRAINDLVIDSWDQSTLTRYDAHMKDFVRFASEQGILNANLFPVSEATLCFFVTSMAGRISGRTISAKLSAIRSWHIRNDLPWIGRGLRLSQALKAAERLRPATSFREPRPPVTLPMLESLQACLDFSDNEDVCVWAIATTAFWGQIRLGELLPTSTNFDPILLPSWSDFGSPNANGSRSLHLPHTKVGGARGQSVVITRQFEAYDPIGAIEGHASVNASSPSDLLCSFLANDGSRQIMTSRRFLARFNDYLVQFEYPKISGHCFRIGGTTALLLGGIPPDVVKVLGRWSSDAFVRYWRSIEILAPLYIELLGSDFLDAFPALA